MKVESGLLPAVLLLLAPLSYTGSVVQAQQTRTDSYIESLRADMHADRVAIITKAMNFNDKDSAVFWPIYKKYAYDLSKPDDQRVQLIKEYAQDFTTLADVQAKDMADRLFKYQSARIDLKKKYQGIQQRIGRRNCGEILPAGNRLDLLVDVALAPDLPPLLARSDSAQ